MVFGGYYFTCQGDRNSYRMRYIQLDVDVTQLMGTLGVGTLGMGGGRAHHAKGIDGSKHRAGSAVGSSENMFFEVCRALYPTNLPHVGRPGVLSSPCGLDGECEERNGVSENCKGSGKRDRRNRINCETYASPRCRNKARQPYETRHRLQHVVRTVAMRTTRKVHTNIAVALNFTTEQENSVAADSEPRHPEESEPSKLKGNIGCPGVVAEETDDDPKRSIGIFLYTRKARDSHRCDGTGVKGRGGDTENRVEGDDPVIV